MSVEDLKRFSRRLQVAINESEIMDKRVKKLAEDIKNHLPSKWCNKDYIDDEDLLKLAYYLFEGYILPHESVYVDDKSEITSLKSELEQAKATLAEAVEFMEKREFHSAGCEDFIDKLPGAKCYCGLDSLLSKIKGKAGI